MSALIIHGRKSLALVEQCHQKWGSKKGAGPTFFSICLTVEDGILTLETMAAHNGGQQGLMVVLLSESV